MIIVGKSLREISLRKSSSHASTQASVPTGDAPIATAQLARITRSLTSLPSAPPHAVEVLQELPHRGRAIGFDPGLDPAEHTGVNTLRIIGCLNQIRSKSHDKYGFAKPLGAELADVPRDFASAHRVPDQRNAG